MRDRLIDGLIQGDRLAWAAIGMLWLLTALVVLLHRPGLGGARQAAWTWLLFAVATGTSLAGLPLSAALAVPRLRWTAVDAPDLVATGGDTWRRLRGPAVLVAGPDIAVPTLDAADHWVLFGLLSGKPIQGLPAAEAAPMIPGAPRLCRTEGEACRPWPVAWPDPARPIALAELVWSHAGQEAGLGNGARVADRSGAATVPVERVEGALAYDMETGLYLRRVEPAPGTASGTPQLELVGRITADPRGEAPSVLFVVSKVEAGRLKAMRIAAVPETGKPGPLFRLQRAEVSLTGGPRVLGWVVRPLLALTSFSLPLGVLAFLLAPLLRRRSGETRRDAAAWISPYLEAAAVLAAGVAAAAPAVVAIASLWGSR